MDALTILAILLAFAVFITRLPRILWPGRTRTLFKKLGGSSKSQLVQLAVILGVAGFLILLYTLMNVPLQGIVTTVFAFSLLFAAWMCLHSDLLRAFDGYLYKRSDNWIRIHSAAAVLLSVIVVVLLASRL